MKTYTVTVTYTIHGVKRTIEFVYKLNLQQTDHMVYGLTDRMVYGPIVDAAASVVSKTEGWGSENVSAINVTWEEEA